MFQEFLAIKEDFARRVSEAASEPTISEANIKTNILAKNVDVAIPVSPPTCTLQTQQNAITPVDIMKSDILTVNESVSLGSDDVEYNETPIVSAISDSPVIVPKVPINKKPIKNEQPLVVVDNNKPLPPNKQKQNKNKPLVPQNEDEKAIENTAVTLSTISLTPQPQRIRESRERRKSEEKINSEESQPKVNADPNVPTVIPTTG